MYMAVIEHYSNVMAFSEDKEKAKKNAIRMAKKVHSYPLKSWDDVLDTFGGYVVEIKDGATFYEEHIKCGCCDGIIDD